MEKKLNREVIARVRIGSVVYGTNTSYSDIDYRTIVRGDLIIPKDENDREIRHLNWLNLLDARDVFAVEIAQSAKEDIIETSDSFKIIHGVDFFDEKLAKDYGGWANIFIERYQTRQGEDHKNLMNACLFAWRGFEIIQGHKHPLMLSPDLQHDMRKIRREGYTDLADTYLALLGKY